MFKFWPSAALKEAWTTYNSEQERNLNRLFLSCKILEQTTDQFIVRLAEKGPKKQKTEQKFEKPLNSSRLQKAQQRGDFVKFFDSSDSSDEESEEKPKPKPVAQKRKVESSESQGEESEDEQTSREWDEYCFVCNDGGNVICCDGCTNVAHLNCLKMKSEPTGDWHCQQCLTKIQQKGSTRGTRKASQQVVSQSRFAQRRSTRR